MSRRSGARTPYKQVAAVLAGHRLRAVPVVDSIGRVIGVVSESDLLVRAAGRAGRHHPQLSLRQALARERKLRALTADRLMTAPAVNVAPSDSIRTAAALSDAHDVRQLIVVDDERKVIGIVSRAELLREYLRTDAAIRDEIVDGVLERIFSLEPDTVQVGVRDGVATLSGQLESAALDGDLIRTVEAVPGVVRVENQLTMLHDPLAPRPHRTPQTTPRPS